MFTSDQASTRTQIFSIMKKVNVCGDVRDKKSKNLKIERRSATAIANFTAEVKNDGPAIFRIHGSEDLH